MLQASRELQQLQSCNAENPVSPMQAMNEVQKRFKRNLPELDPETDMSVTDSDYRKSPAQV